MNVDRAYVHIPSGCLLGAHPQPSQVTDEWSAAPDAHHPIAWRCAPSPAHMSVCLAPALADWRVGWIARRCMRTKGNAASGMRAWLTRESDISGKLSVLRCWSLGEPADADTRTTRSHARISLTASRRTVRSSPLRTHREGHPARSRRAHTCPERCEHLVRPHRSNNIAPCYFA